MVDELVVLEELDVEELVVDEEVVLLDEDELDEVEDEESLKAIPIAPQSSEAHTQSTTIFPAAPVSKSYSDSQVWFPISSLCISV